MKSIIFIVLYVCGVRSILNGRDALPGEAPWHMRVQINGAFLGQQDVSCGGALIGARTVLTAAHCCDDHMLRRNGMNVTGENTIRYGGVDKRTLPGSVEAMKKILHPSWNSSTVVNDLCILHLNHSIHENDMVKIIKLADTQPSVNSNVNMSGWGLCAPDIYPDHLKFMEMSIYPWHECHDLWKNYTKEIPFPAGIDLEITSNIICAKSVRRNVDLYNGDSGSPLVIHSPEARLVGIVSMGIPTCPTMGKYILPAGFNNIAKYRKWIESNII